MKSHNYYNTITTKLISSFVVFLLLQSCHNSSSNFARSNTPNNLTESSGSKKPSEIIVFCGNPGVGKSTLCNSIFGQVIFESGLSALTGLTTMEQNHLYRGKLYIDTPGLDDVKRRIQAAKEIEKALKHNNDYKIIFVVKTDGARIRGADLATINLVCETIQTPFEYGIVLNQVSAEEIQLFEKLGITEKRIIDFLSGSNTEISILAKRPASVVILKEDIALKNKNNKHLQTNDENRKKLLDFIDNLKANNIRERDVKKIEIRSIDEIAKEIGKKYEEKLEEVKKKAKEEGCNCVIS